MKVKYLLGERSSTLVTSVEREILGHPDLSGRRPCAAALWLGLVPSGVRRRVARRHGAGGGGVTQVYVFLTAAGERRAGGARLLSLLPLLLAGDGGGGHEGRRWEILLLPGGGGRRRGGGRRGGGQGGWRGGRGRRGTLLLARHRGRGRGGRRGGVASVHFLLDAAARPLVGARRVEDGLGQPLHRPALQLGHDLAEVRGRLLVDHGDVAQDVPLAAGLVAAGAGQR